MEIKIRRATSAYLYETNPVLASGEPCLETDTRRIKYGDGATPWRNLAYANPNVNFDGGELSAPAPGSEPGSFTPPSLEGLALWLDGSSRFEGFVSVVGSGVSQWLDKSADKNNFFQSLKENRPVNSGTINGLGVLTFDGEDDAMLGSFKLPPECTFFVVLKRNGASTNGRVFTGTRMDDSEFSFCATEDGTSFGVLADGDYLAVQEVSDLTTVLYGLTVSGTSLVTRLNGLSAQTADYTSDIRFKNFSVGSSRANYSTGAYSGHIAEIVVYDRVLSDTERQQVDAYLLGRWGIVQTVHPLLDGMVAFWPMNEQDGNRADASGNNKTFVVGTGSASQVVSSADGVIGRAAVFTGQNYLEADIVPAVLSFSCWFKIAAADAQKPCHQIIGQWKGGGSWILIHTPNGLAVDINTGGAVIPASGTNLADDSWHHVVGTYDAGTYKLYVDNELYGSVATSIPSSESPDRKLRLGICDYDDSNDYRMIGLVDSVGVWDRTLSADDVAMLWNGGFGKEDFTADTYGDNVSLLLHMNKLPNAVVSSGTDPNWDNVALLLHMDGTDGSTTFTDSSSNGLTVTAAGSAAISTAQSQFGGASGRFNGTGDYLDVLDLPADYMDGDFTIEAWVNISGNTINQCLFNTQPHNSLVISLNRDGTGYTHVYIGNGSSWLADIQSANQLSYDTWHHVAVVKNSGTLTLYHDGEAQATSTVVPTGYSPVARISGITLFVAEGLDGYIDDLRITKGVARYTANFTPPTAAFPDGPVPPKMEPYSTSLLLHFDGDMPFKDSSSGNLTVTPAGNATITTTQSKFGGACAAFNGNGDRLDVATNSLFDLGGGDYTIECFFKVTDLSGPDSTRLWTFETNSESWGLLLVNDGTGRIAMNHFGVPVSIESPNGSITTDIWYHIALVKYGGTATLYLNGTSVGSDSTYAWVPQGPSQLSIGGNILNYPYTKCNGYVDEFRVVNGTAVYTGNFTPPTAPLTAVSGTSLLLHFDETGLLDSSPNGLAVSATGTAATSTAQSKFGGSSAYFDGSGDWLSVPENGLFRFGSEDFTIELWLNVPDANQKINWHNNGSMNPQVVLGTTPIAANTWTHVAVTKQNTTVRLFVSGALDATGEVAAVLENNADPLYIGRGADHTGNNTNRDILHCGEVGGETPKWFFYLTGNGGGDFNGYIDDLRIVKGKALYTENFTPPTAPLLPVQKQYDTAGTVLMLNFNGSDGSTTFTDSSSNELTVTATGSAAISTTESKFGGSSAYFPGNADTLTCADSPLFGFGTGDFTIEMFAYISGGTRNSVISVGTYQNGILWRLGSGGFNAGADSLWFAGTMYGWLSSQPPLNTWAHFALTRQGSVVRCFVDGSMAFEQDIGTVDLGDSKPLTIGCGAHELASIDAFHGYIDDLRIVKGKALYTENFTPPTSELTATQPVQPALLLHFNDVDGSTNFVDSSNNALTVTANGNAVISGAQYKFGGASGSFPQSGSGLSLPQSSDLNFGTGDFTVEAWIYKSSIGVSEFIVDGNQNGSMFFGFESGGLGVGRHWVAWDHVANFSSNGGVFDQWNHVAATRQSGTIRLFINGSMALQESSSENYDLGASGTNVGWNPLNGNIALNGYIDDLRVVKGTALYTANFTPPTRELPDPVPTPPPVIEPSLLLHFDGSNGSTTFTDSSATALTVVANGDAAISTAQSKFGGASLYVSNSDTSYAVSSTNISFAENEDFTIEAWLYRDANAYNYEEILLVYDNTFDNFFGLFIGDGSRQFMFFDRVNGAYEYPCPGWAASVPLGEWVHVAASRQAGKVRTFLNGTLNEESAPGTYTAAIQGNLRIGAAYTQGYIDELRIVKGTAVYTGNFTPPTAPFPNPAVSTAITYFYDNSKYNHTVTANGDAQISTAEIKFGNGSGKFDGDGDYLTLAAVEALHFGADDFTVECWIRSANWNAGDYQTLIGCNSGDCGALFIPIGNDGTIKVGGQCNGWLIEAPHTMQADTWHHLAVSRSGGTLSVFQDGVQIGSVADDTDFVVASAVSIGVMGPGAPSSSLNGYIDDLRITKGVGRYTANFTPPAKELPDPILVPAETAGDPYAEYVTLLLHMDGADGSTSFVDNSYLQNTVTANGDAQISTAQSKFGGASGYFDGSSYVSTAASDAFAFGTADFTIECWFYGSVLNAWQVIYSQAQSGNNYCVLGVENGIVTFIHNYNNPGVYVYGSSVSAGGWHHVAVCRNNGVITVYTDGVAGDPVSSSFDFDATTFDPTIGSYGFNTSYNFNGYIDDLRITKGVARYTADFTPPTAAFPSPFTPEPPPALLLHFDGSNGSTTFTDSSPNAWPATPNGGVQISTAESKFGGSSGYFAAHGDHLSFPPGAGDLGAGDFTIECWLYADAPFSTYRTLAGTFQSWDSTSGKWMILNGPGEQGLSFWTAENDTNTGGSVFYTFATIPLYTWCHCAWVRSNGVLYSYLNGVLQGSNILQQQLTPQDTELWVGHAPESVYGRNWIGYIDDFRIVKGTAVYTDDFTPPTQSFSGGFTPKLVTGNDLWLDASDLSTVHELGGSITSWDDKSGMGNDAVQYGVYATPSLASSATPSGLDAVRFNGDPNALEVANQFNLKNSSGFVVVRQTSLSNGSGYPRIIGFQPASGADSNENDGMSLVVNNYSDFGVEIWSGSSGVRLCGHEMALPFGWTLLSYTVDGDGNVTLRVNGQEVDSGSNPDMADSAGGDLLVGFGGFLQSVEALQGDLAAVVLYDHKLGPAAFGAVEKYLTEKYLGNDPTVLLLHFDGTLSDSSRNQFSPTAMGSAATSTAVKKFGTSSVHIPDNNSYVSISNSPKLEFSGDFTIEGWFYATELSNGANGMWAGADDNVGGLNTGGAFLWINSSGNVNMQVAGGGSWVIDSFSTGLAFSQDKWHHVALVRSGNTLTPYVDGVAGNAASYGGAIQNHNYFIVGKATGTNQNFIGYIDEFRVTNGVALYDGDFDVPDLPFGAELSLLLHMDGDFNDATSHFTFVQPGNAATQTNSPAKFGDSADLVTGGLLSNEQILLPENSDFTIEFWQYNAAQRFNGATPQPLIFSIDGNDGVGRPTDLQLFAHDNDRNMFLANISYLTDGYANPEPTFQQWEHVAIVRHAGTLTVYQNGVSYESVEHTSAVSGYVRISCKEYTSSMFDLDYAGYIDEFRIIKGYAAYTDNFTPPDLPFGSELSLLLHMDSDFSDSSPSNLTLTNNGATISTAESRFGGASLALNDGYLASGGYEVPNLGDEWTIEAFVWRPTGTGDSTILNLSSMPNVPYGHHFWINSASQLRWDEGTQECATGGSVIAEQWTHVAAARKNGTVTIYVDGQSVATSNVAPGAGPYKIWIGCHDNQLGGGFLSGMYIDELRVVKGTAIYNGDFDPPDLPFGARTSLLLHMDSDFSDSSGNNVSVTANGGAQISTAQSVFGGASGYFDGNDDHLRTSLSMDWAADFTIEFWFMRSGTGSGGADCLFAAGDINPSRGGLHIYVNGSGTFFADNALVGAISGGNAPIGMWVHVALVRSSGTNTLYVGGVAVGTSQQDFSANIANNIVDIGGTPNYGFYANGWIDELRIIKGYALYNGDFTPPSAPF